MKSTNSSDQSHQRNGGEISQIELSKPQLPQSIIIKNEVSDDIYSKIDQKESSMALKEEIDIKVETEEVKVKNEEIEIKVETEKTEVKVKIENLKKAEEIKLEVPRTIKFVEVPRNIKFVEVPRNIKFVKVPRTKKIVEVPRTKKIVDPENRWFDGPSTLIKKKDVAVLALVDFLQSEPNCLPLDDIFSRISDLLEIDEESISKRYFNHLHPNKSKYGKCFLVFKIELVKDVQLTAKTLKSYIAILSATDPKYWVPNNLILLNCDHTLQCLPAVSVKMPYIENSEFGIDANLLLLAIKKHCKGKEGMNLSNLQSKFAMEDILRKSEITFHPENKIPKVGLTEWQNKVARWQGIHERTVKGNLKEIYSGNISGETAKTATRIVNIRKKLLQKEET